MDYKEKYENALEKMKSWANGEHPECFSEAQKAAEFIFPELAESEDKRITRAINNMLPFIPERAYANNGVTKEDVLTWLEEQGEPQPYKGNADTMRKNLIKAFKSVGSNHWGGLDVRDIIHFLESKDAIELEKQSEKNPAWSKEDEKILGKCIDAASGYYSPEDKQSMKNWLKSLKDRVQSHWKPTEEQMNCFKQAIDLFKMKVNDDSVLRNLNSLYENLKNFEIWNTYQMKHQRRFMWK